MAMMMVAMEDVGDERDGQCSGTYALPVSLISADEPCWVAQLTRNTRRATSTSSSRIQVLRAVVRYRYSC